MLREISLAAGSCLAALAWAIPRSRDRSTGIAARSLSPRLASPLARLALFVCLFPVLSY
jgi:hypothetical protein